MSFFNERRLMLAVVIAASLLTSVHAQTLVPYPTRALKMIVPFPPSGSTDIVARTVAERLGQALGQTVIVENKPGATGAIGLEALARSEPDGYTIGLGTIGSIAINPAVNKKLSWDPLKDFAAVGFVGSTPFALLVGASSKAQTLEEFIALAKQQPGKLTYATGGTGGSQHLASILLEESAGIQMRHIPYKGSGPALIDLMGGQVDALIEPAVSAIPHVKSGKLRILALTGAKRSASFPGVPIMADTLPGYDMAAWFAFFAPAGTPKPFLQRLNQELRLILEQPLVIERLAQAGVELAPSSVEELDRYLQNELSRWLRIVKKANVTVD